MQNTKFLLKLLVIIILSGSYTAHSGIGPVIPIVPPPIVTQSVQNMWRRFLISVVSPVAAQIGIRVNPFRNIRFQPVTRPTRNFMIDDVLAVVIGFLDERNRGVLRLVSRDMNRFFRVIEAHEYDWPNIPLEAPDPSGMHRIENWLFINYRSQNFITAFNTQTFESHRIILPGRVTAMTDNGYDLFLGGHTVRIDRERPNRLIFINQHTGISHSMRMRGRPQALSWDGERFLYVLNEATRTSIANIQILDLEQVYRILSDS